MPDEIKISKCPLCGGIWAEGECYKCGAYMENGKVVPSKPGEGPPATVPAGPPAESPNPNRTEPAPKPAWDEP